MTGNKKLTLMNILSALLLQLCTIASGFVIPKIILSYFGSEVNGLISSVNQFLNYVQLLEGGLSGVVMAALYKALAEKNYEKVSAIIKAVKSFFKKIALIYIVYALVMAFVYPLIVHNDFDYWYVVTLIVIISVNLFIQYLFSLTYRLLLTSDRRGYIVSFTQTAFIILNLVFVIVSVKLYPNIHIMKLISAVAFLIQPLVFGIYVKKHYKIDKKAAADKTALKERWAGFGQNLAYFVHSNTDVALLTLCVGLSVVSVYSVHLMIISAVQSIIIAVSGAVKPIFGNILVIKDNEYVNRVFDYYEIGINVLTTVLFTCCAVLIVPFIKLYTADISDADYIQPVFAVLLCVAEAIYCYRDPYVAVAYAVGHFRQTAKYAYIEAGLNIAISLTLVFFIGLIGVAIGTIVSMLFRMIMHVIYIKKNVLNRSVLKWVKNFFSSFGAGAIGVVIAQFCISYNVNTYSDWIVYALITSGIAIAVTGLITYAFNFKSINRFVKSYLTHKKKKKVSSDETE